MNAVVQMDANTLELMVDRLGMFGVLELLERVAYDKEEHVKANWQDMALGTCWKRVAEHVGKAAAFASKTNL